MNWINAFELLCYGITALLLADVVHRRSWRELRLFCSAALAGFVLELLAVRVTGIYHYSPSFYINLGVSPYQFPFFGGLMWGGLTVCGLRIAEKLYMGSLMTAFVTGWLIVSMDLLLDVAAIRLDGGFWVWEGREITLDVNHHMFMSVIWVNFLGYLFETPAVVFFHCLTEERGAKRSAGRIASDTVLVGLGGIAVVGAASGLSLWMNSITDEWFACIAFMSLWGVILACLLLAIARSRSHFTLKGKKDVPVLIFWTAMYGYCLAALWSLGIMQAVPIYGVFAMILASGILLLSAAKNEGETK
ncbi:MAG: DUF422 domain-containing protein [Clostridia bacterium]|nr:DUF422 domain-containing protein [Clostridia bacterium]